MKKILLPTVFICSCAVISFTAAAQVYRAASTEALENNGKAWVEKKLPPSVITFSDFSGLVEIKTNLSAQQEDSSASQQVAADYADLTMNIDRDQLPEQIAAAKTYTTTGTLVINNISKKINVQYMLEPRNTGGGFTIAVIMRFNPADFNIQMKDEPANEPMIVKVSSGYLNKQSNNF